MNCVVCKEPLSNHVQEKFVPHWPNKNKGCLDFTLPNGCPAEAACLEQIKQAYKVVLGRKRDKDTDLPIVG